MDYSINTYFFDSIVKNKGTPKLGSNSGCKEEKLIVKKTEGINMDKAVCCYLNKFRLSLTIMFLSF